MKGFMAPRGLLNLLRAVPGGGKNRAQQERGPAIFWGCFFYGVLFTLGNGWSKNVGVARTRGSMHHITQQQNLSRLVFDPA